MKGVAVVEGDVRMLDASSKEASNYPIDPEEIIEHGKIGKREEKEEKRKE